MSDIYIIEAIIGAEDLKTVRLPDAPQQPYAIADLYNAAMAYATENSIPFDTVGIVQYKNGQMISPSLTSGARINFELARSLNGARQNTVTS